MKKAKTGNKVENIDSCPECASPNIVCSPEKNTVVCKDCGLIYNASKGQKCAVNPMAR